MMNSNRHINLIVVFGRPGAGKTTIATAAIKQLNKSYGLDLDVCVPDWMKANFAKSIYPTLEERKVFALDCCEYVEKEINNIIQKKSDENMITVIISFSFVNTDLRDIFRSHFQKAKWVLVDTTEEEAAIRIQTRKDHFYKGDTSKQSIDELSSKDTTEESTERNGSKTDIDNSDWHFAPVTFPHVILDGNAPITENAEKLIQIWLENL